MRKKIISALILVLIATMAYAASIRQRFTFMPELGGLNTTINPLNLDPKMLITANNVLYDLVGTRKKRGGQLKLNSTAIAESSNNDTVMGIFNFRKIDSDGDETQKLVAYCGGKLFKMDNFDGTWDDISSGVLTINQIPDFAVLRKADTTTDTLLIVNGTQTPQTWDQDSATVSDLTGTPTDVNFYPNCIETHKFRLWASGVPTYPYRVYFSAANVHDDWNAEGDAGHIDIIDSMGGRVKAIVGNYFDYLIIFTDSSIHRISGSSYNDFAATPIQTGIGSINNASVVPFGNDIYFVSDKGIHSLATTEKYGDVRETYLSAPIQIDFNSLSSVRLEHCVGAVWPKLNYIIWSFSDAGSGENDICFVYDYIGKRWSKWTGIEAASFAIVKNASNQNELVAGNYDGFVNRLNRTNYNDNGSAYTMIFTTPYIHLGDPIIDKIFKELFMFFKPQGNTTFTVEYRIDSDDSNSFTVSQAGGENTLGGFVLGTDRLGGDEVAVKNQPLTGTGRMIQFTFEQDDVDVGCEIYAYGMGVLSAGINYSN